MLLISFMLKFGKFHKIALSMIESLKLTRLGKFESWYIIGYLIFKLICDIIIVICIFDIFYAEVLNLKKGQYSCLKAQN